MVSIDGGVVGGWGEGLHDDPEADLVALTDRLQSEQLGEEFDGDWPKCRIIGTLSCSRRTRAEQPCGHAG